MPRLHQQEFTTVTENGVHCLKKVTSTLLHGARPFRVQLDLPGLLVTSTRQGIFLLLHVSAHFLPWTLRRARMQASEPCSNVISSLHQSWRSKIGRNPVLSWPSVHSSAKVPRLPHYNFIFKQLSSPLSPPGVRSNPAASSPNTVL